MGELFASPFTMVIWGAATSATQLAKWISVYPLKKLGEGIPARTLKEDKLARPIYLCGNDPDHFLPHNQVRLAVLVSEECKDAQLSFTPYIYIFVFS
jgi:hypothetical protein